MTRIRTALELCGRSEEDTNYFCKKHQKVRSTKTKGTTKVNSIPAKSDRTNLLKMKFLASRSSEVTINTPHFESSGWPHLSTCKTEPTKSCECCWPRETSCCRLLSVGRRLAEFCFPPKKTKDVDVPLFNSADDWCS